MKKTIILFFIFSILITSNIYADEYSEKINRINLELKQKLQREPIKIELKGAREGIITYSTNVYIRRLKVKKIELKPKKLKK